MRIFVTVKPRKMEEKVERVDVTHYLVYTKAPPVDNKANEAVIKILSVHFDLPKWKIQIVSGQTSRKKIIEVGK
ncbi:DUF167 domain-containing protein [Candidatus Roizmanbacteria bacterium]|nr:DUF167 domain-containing protein [Candidatus Roizmanbacteria bacterium]